MIAAASMITLLCSRWGNGPSPLRRKGVVPQTDGVVKRAESGEARSSIIKGVGIDVSLEASSVCVVDGNGKIVREGKIASEPDALIAWLKGLKLELTRIGLICCGQSYVA
jgi:hypothetical protein